eukprot:Skav207336  [mRNA]  locus=scaffold426:19669:24820:+ [translate_table: standard]
MIKVPGPAAAFAALGLLCFTNEAGATSIRRHVKAGALCEFAEKEPLLSCSKVAAGGSSWNSNLHEAWHQLCQDSQTSPYMEVFLDKRFKDNYHHVYKSDGWTETAWVNYVAVKKSGGVFGKLTERLVESIHRFSHHPIVVVNFGQEAPEELSAQRFPRLVCPVRIHEAAAACEAKDMLLVGPQADQLLNRTGEEITEKQLSGEKGVGLELNESWMRTSQNGVPTDDIAEDEDLLNVALWYRDRKGS